MLFCVACARGGTARDRAHADRVGPRSRSGPDGPDHTNTGVPRGVHLTSSGSVVVDDDGAVVSALDVHGTIHVRADDVTIRDSRVTSSDYWPILLEPDHHGLVVTDTTVVGSGSCQAGIGTRNYHAIRLDVHGCGDGAKAGDDTTIEDSWFHDLLVTPGSHNDGIQVGAGDHIMIRGNRISAPTGQTSAIMIGPDYGTPISDVRIEDNRLDGGAYAIHLDANDAVIRGNRFGTRSTYGPAYLGTTPVVWVDNVRADTGEPVSP